MNFSFLFIIFIAFGSSLFAHGNSSTTSYPFTENKGQWHENVLFKSRVDGATIYFEKNAFHYQFISKPDYHLGNIPEDTMARGHIFKAQFLNANNQVEISTIRSSDFYYNYYLGDNESKWQSEVRSFSAIRYSNLYNGIDLEVYSENGFTKYDYIVETGSNPNQIAVQYFGVNKPVIKDDQLVISHELGELIEEKPFAYQVINGIKTKVNCNYKLNESGILQFEFPEGYDADFDLIIDPKLIFSTYSGSTADNFGETATYDDLGNGYMGGIADGQQYILTIGAYQTVYGGDDWDIAISKFSADGSTLVYSTFLGGRRNETVHSMVVDANQNLFVFGATGSNNFPTTSNAYDQTFNPSSSSIITDINVQYSFGAEIIVSKFNHTGTRLLGSTFYGDDGIDGVNQNPPGGADYDGLNFNYGDSHRGEIILDSTGNCYIGTTTTSNNLIGSLGSYGGNQDGLVLKFDSTLSNLLWSRYIGGSQRDAIYSLKVIDSNKVLIGGGTTSYDDFPVTPGSLQTSSLQNRTVSREQADGFISILSSDGSTVEKSTFISTANYDQVYFVEFDRFNNIYGYGQTQGGLFPTLRAPRANVGAGQFIVKLDRNLDSLEFSTTFGNGGGTGQVNISPTAFLVDRCQNIYAAGWGEEIIRNDTTNGIITFGEGDKSINNMLVINNGDPSIPASTSSTDGNDFYLYVINRNVDSVLYASYFGGRGTSSRDHVDGGTSRFDKNGVVYHSVCASCGFSNRTDFPTTLNAYSRRDNSNNCNNALFKLDFEILIRADFSLTNADFCLKPGEIDSVTVMNSSVGSTNITWDFYGDTVVSNFRDTTIYFATPGRYTIRQVVFDSICAIGDFLDLNVNVRPDDIDITIDFDTLVCYTDSTDIIVSTNNKANRFLFSTSRDFGLLINPNNTDSTLRVQLQPGNNTFYVQASNPTTDACEKVDSIRIFYSPTTANASISANTVCEGTPIQFNANISNVDTFSWNFGDGNSYANLNPNFSYPNPGNYNAYFVYENQACLQKDSIPFSIQVVNNDLQINSPIDTFFCGTGVFNVSVPSSGTITDYQYSSNRQFTDRLNANASVNSFLINQTDSTLYYFKVSNNFCDLTDSILVQYIEYDFDLGPILDSACVVHFQPVQSRVIGADSFRIVSSNGASFTNNASPLIIFTQQGNYTVKLLTSNARCNRKDSIVRTISIFENVELVSIPDTMLCIGDSVTVTSNSSGTAANFAWSTNADLSSPFAFGPDSSIKLSPKTTTRYYLQGINSICFDTDTFDVDIEDLTIDVNDFESFCIYDTIDIRAMVTQASSPLSYSWSPADSILSATDAISIRIAPLANQFYYLKTVSQTGCEDFDTVEVEVNLPAFDDAFINGVDSLFKGQQTQLSTNRNGSNLVYQWEPAKDFDNPSSAAPSTTLDSSKLYTVTITDLNTGCVVVAQKRLRVFEVNCAEPDIFVPTAFSPNSDLTNDILYVRGANIRELEFQLFNRWGELIFETNEINKGWDGRYQGKKVEHGVFVYQLKAICFDGQEFIDKGNITLLK